MAANLGEPLPDVDHAVSVSLPSFASNIGYEEGAEWVTSSMKTGYPRFLINPEIKALAVSIVSRYGHPDQTAMLFPSLAIAKQCLEFIPRRKDSVIQEDSVSEKQDKILRLRVRDEESNVNVEVQEVFAVLLRASEWEAAMKFWQHTGEGVSSRRARYLQRAFDDGRLGLRSGDMVVNGNDYGNWIEQVNESGGWKSFEVDGKDLAGERAKAIIKARIAGDLDAFDKADTTSVSVESEAHDGVRKVPKDDVFLYPTGMSAIFNTHQLLLKSKGQLPSIMFGFPYTDTLKVLQSFGPGCVFYGHASQIELDDLECRCKQGEKFLALFYESPGNPLLRTPDLHRIRRLAEKFDFAVVVDDTVGNYLNVDVLPCADVVVSSLTKLFSGGSNVMGGSAVLNPQGRYHAALRRTLEANYRDHYWPEDAVVMEENSRDFMERSQKINLNTQKLIGRLQESPIIKTIFHPSLDSTKHLYDAHRTARGGYGGLLSLTFHQDEDARYFFDALSVAKGPSLGTNFTIASPYVILAHYHELEWAAEHGVPAALVRVSVGTEPYEEVLDAFETALRAIEVQRSKRAGDQETRVGLGGTATWLVLENTGNDIRLGYFQVHTEETPDVMG